MSDSTPNSENLWRPRYWPTWLGLGVLWLVAQVPWRWQMTLGKWLGLAMFHTLKKRRFVCCVNLELAFPELSEAERTALNRAHFISLGRGLLEAAFSWWGRAKALQPLAQVEGLEHLLKAHAHGGVLLLSAHFTSLDIAGRLIRGHIPFSIQLVYRPHQNPVIEQAVANVRASYNGKVISRDEIRQMVRSLRAGEAVWYAPDQHFNQKNSVFVPFFGVEAATNTATTRLADLGHAQVVPFFSVRTAQGYLLRFLPALEDFPGESVHTDTLRINRIIEQQVREFPDQYLWTHRRFKSSPEGHNRYDQYLSGHPASRC
ncbi:LpxL/LpxP family Kdo(2)-lipid IV(A) lauroyl/palmitoleoyl acyltransferase [Thiolinea disciformis]|uniref:LpxL/LpxP family Kdo(2)-lipid IV(A) lauroyl/palmitoleoyl acyltransferase n=1 Tax=Thiolinea disciformis TaxID=125614 RepID=UPI000364DE90|nr:LpxL/LpxP family Kdo(2)-lipid IV(A) lauroyl/palmitoleoyl acyltransferase [Thiolinea disciformis]